MANVPADLKYTKEHEWAKLEGDKARVGITAFAQEQLGDVVFVELPKVGAKITRDEDLRRGRVGQGRLGSLRSADRRGGRDQCRAAQEARGGQRRPLRQGLDDRRQARRAPRSGTRSCRRRDYEKLIAGRGTETMRYISNTPAQQREMLATIGVGSIEELLVARAGEGAALATAQRPGGHGRDRSRPPPAGSLSAECERRRLRLLPRRRAPTTTACRARSIT